MPRPCLSNHGPAEGQYLDLIRAIEAYGVDRTDRTGTGTRSLQGETMRYSLRGGVVPLLTTKKIAFRLPESELRWLLSGSTSIVPLLQENNTIWSDWPHAKYQQATGDQISQAEFNRRVLEDPAFAHRWGDLGPVYGKQWRRWQGPDGQEYDQVQDVIDRIRSTPDSRRLIFHGWNVPDLDRMALPPCHLLYQFYVANGELSLTLYQRSCDVGLGVPFNIASAALLVHMMAQQCDLQPGELFWVGHDVHVYQNHWEALHTQLEREPRPFPTVRFTRRPESLFEYRPGDVVLENYTPHPAIAMPVAV